MHHPFLDRPFWIFDMDGTLTVPAHDFAAFEDAHGVPRGTDLLTAANSRPPTERATFLQAISDWEHKIALSARAQDDAVGLLAHLAGSGVSLGIVTRNTKAHALTTLHAAGLSKWFPNQAHVFGRDCAAPKPAPGADGLVGGPS